MIVGNKKARKHEKKRNFLSWIKKKGNTALVTGSLLIVASACLIVGLGLTEGWDTMVGWLTSDWAFFCYAAVLIWALIVVYLMYLDRMGDGNGK